MASLMMALGNKALIPLLGKDSGTTLNEYCLQLHTLPFQWPNIIANVTFLVIIQLFVGVKRIIVVRTSQGMVALTSHHTVSRVPTVAPLVAALMDKLKAATEVEVKVSYCIHLYITWH